MNSIVISNIENICANPISLRVWYPRVAEDDSFERLLDDLKYIRAERVYLFDNSYMDNYQLLPETLDERLPILTRRVSRLTQEGIIVGINAGATIGHRPRPEIAGRIMDLDWWVGSDGKELMGVACPLGARFRAWLKDYFRRLAEIGASEIFIDDDFRLAGHGDPPPNGWGCTCEMHLRKLERDFGHKLSRRELMQAIGTLSPGPVREDWLSLWKSDFLDLLRLIERTVHRVDPSIRLGLMPVQSLIQAFGEDFLPKAIEAVSNGNRPLLRTHDYHGLPHELTPGSGLAAKRTARADAEHVVEVENLFHNCHDYIRSPKTTRFAILSALAVGMGGAAVTFGDSERDMPWERRYLDMLRESDPFFRTVAELTNRDTVMRGVPIRHRAYQRRRAYIDVVGHIIQDTRHEQPDTLAGVFGFAYQFDDARPAMLLGNLPASMTLDEVRETLSRGAIIDVAALRCLNELGFGEELGVEVGEMLSRRRGQRFLDHPFNGDYGGDVNALRVDFEVYRLEADPREYTEVTEFVSWSGERVAGGILARSDGRGRNVILPNTLSLQPPNLSGIVNTQYRSLVRQLLASVTGQPLTLAMEGPPHVKLFYFERKSDGAVIITLLNGYYDDVYDFDLLLGDGERLASKTVYGVKPDGSIEHTGLRVQHLNGSYRLHIDSENRLGNCDVKVLVLE